MGRFRFRTRAPRGTTKIISARRLSHEGRQLLAWFNELAYFEPDIAQEIRGRLDAIVIAPDEAHPNVRGWVHPDEGRTAFLNYTPTELGFVETMVLIFHEALHVSRKNERFDVFHHTCSDAGCQNPYERDVDPIYTAESALRARLELYVALGI